MIWQMFYILDVGHNTQKEVARCIKLVKEWKWQEPIV